MHLTRTLALAGTLALASAPAFAAEFIDGGINTNANTYIGPGASGLPGNVDTHNALTSAPVSQLTAQQAKPVQATLGANSVNATSDVTASWADANSGTLKVVTTREMILPRKMDNQIDAAVGLFDQSFDNSRPTFDYRFSASGTDNQFSMNYTVALTGDFGPTDPGMGAWNIDFIDITAGNKEIAFGPLANGPVQDKTFTQALTSGHSYEVKILDEEGLLLPDSTFHSLETGDTATFNWNINADGTGGGGGGGAGGVPEPEAWALLILGFGAAGAALRRTRAARRFA